jgi:hypothetical protein
MLPFIIVACSSASDNPQPAPTSQPTQVPANDESVAVPTEIPPASASQSETVAYNGPEWTHVAFTEVTTGESFTFADFAGKTVFVHPMANWCTLCLANQRSLRANVIPQLNSDDFVFVSLNIEPLTSNNSLANYVANNGFDWNFAVAPEDVIPLLVDQFGRSVVVPPSQPHFIIAPDGTPTDLLTGADDPQTLIDLLQSINAAS